MRIITPDKATPEELTKLHKELAHYEKYQSIRTKYVTKYVLKYNPLPILLNGDEYILEVFKLLSLKDRFNMYLELLKL